MEIVSRREARERGLLRFFTGKSCQKGHISERQVSSGDCMACARARKPSEATKLKNSLRGKLWYLARRDTELLRRRENYRINRDRYAAKGEEYRKTRKHEQARRRRKHYEQNSHRYKAQSVARRDFTKRATPAWANSEAINAFYLEAARRTAQSGEKHHVDHIIPLRGKNVCGLHVETNLQVLLASENMAKHNRLLQCA